MQLKIITRQLERTFNGPAWHGPSVLETLDKITVGHAQNQFKDSHTIIQLIAHMATWRKFVTEHFRGNDSYEVEDDMNFPSPTNLNETIQLLKSSQDELMAALKQFPEEKMRDKVPTREYSFQTMLHGIIHHDLYHLGQIALLNR
jgi:uncharacterized damage-inducible protein DinB